MKLHETPFFVAIQFTDPNGILYSNIEIVYAFNERTVKAIIDSVHKKETFTIKTIRPATEEELVKYADKIRC